jgi:glycosyltransferase involved in cell wall biosynthesis
MIVGGAQENTMLSCALMPTEIGRGEILSGLETGPEGQLHDECRSRGVSLRFEPALVRRVSPLHDLLALIRLVRLMRRERFDIVHTHSSKAGILGRVAARLAGCPCVVHTVHGWGFNPAQSRFVHALYVWLERRCAPMCRALIVVGSQGRDEGLALGIGRPEQYRLIRSGIEIEVYRDLAMSRDEARARLGLPADAFVVCSVGRLGLQKSPLDLLAAFVRVARAHPSAHLVLVGDGPQRGDVEAAVSDAGLGERVHLVGLRRDVPEILRACDAFALASRWEGLPRVFPQAMAAGLPIVATRVDGAPDAVREGENGWLVEVGEVEVLAERLLRLARDPARARAMGACGAARVDAFSACRMVDDLVELYRDLTEERASSRREGGVSR